MTGTRPKRSRYDVTPDEPAPAPAPAPWSASEPHEARSLIDAARRDVEQLVQAELGALEAMLGATTQTLDERLRAARAETERLEQETQAMRANKYDELLAKLREQVNAL